MDVRAAEASLDLMELLILPFFMPLFLLGWIVVPEDERELRREEARKEKQLAATWAVLFGRESQVIERKALCLGSYEPEPDEPPE